MKKDTYRASVVPLLLAFIQLSFATVASAQIVDGVAVGQQLESTPNGTGFDPPTTFLNSLPLQKSVYLNPKSGVYFLFGNAGVLKSSGSFGVSGFSPPNFLAWNCGATNLDSSIPALPELLYFTAPVSQVSVAIGSNSHSGSAGGIVALDAGLNVVGVDGVVLSSTLQTVTVDAGVPSISYAVIYGPCVMVADDLSYDTQSSSPNIVGSWTVIYDWECDGDSRSDEWSIYGDGTFTSPGGFSGPWTLTGDQFVLDYGNGTVYTGTINRAGNYMDGTMVNSVGLTGCWTANKISAGDESGPGLSAADSWPQTKDRPLDLSVPKTRFSWDHGHLSRLVHSRGMPGQAATCG